MSSQEQTCDSSQASTKQSKQSHIKVFCRVKPLSHNEEPFRKFFSNPEMQMDKESS